MLCRFNAYDMHTLFYENQVIIEISFLNTSYLYLNVSCHSDGNRPHQVRFGRVLALLSAREDKHSAKAHLMWTVSVRMTTQP